MSSFGERRYITALEARKDPRVGEPSEEMKAAVRASVGADMADELVARTVVLIHELFLVVGERRISEQTAHFLCMSASAAVADDYLAGAAELQEP